MGLKKPSAGVSLPVLTNPAVADEIFYNKEAINQNGEVMTGTVINVNSSTSMGTPSVSGSNLVLNSGTQENGLHINKGGSVGLITALSNLGDAAAGDVASGKTFTSAAGLKVTGTATIPNEVNVSIDTSDLNTDKEYFYDYNDSGEAVVLNYVKVSGVVLGKCYLVYYNNTLVGYSVCYREQRIDIYPVGYISPSGTQISLKDLTFYQL